jgi:hypothetical protein
MSEIRAYKETACLDENELHIEIFIEFYTAGTKETWVTRQRMEIPTTR